jgi:undecaprenyl diphosphate synthase
MNPDPVKHVAIIMDGNGRWGVKHKQSRNAGHRAGLNTVNLIINHCINYKIKFLTLYTFSSENWKRPKTEITFLFNLLENFLQKRINKIIEKDIKLKFIGELNKLPTKLQKLIKQSEKKTFNKKILQVNIALNYGSKIELINTIKKIKQKKIPINEKNIDNNLYTKDLPNPDILIRTGNTHRLSNFLLWQLSYTEIFFERKLWPDFKSKDFNKIINEFKRTKRNFGSI